jgi:type I restriction enzyme S subunit
MIKELTMEKTSFPAGWKYKKLSELCKTGAGGTPLKSHKDYYVNGNIPWLRSGEVNNRSITKSELFITEKGLNNSSAKLFPKNSVLVAMYGATAGQVGILCFECSTNQAVCGIFPNDNIIPEFIYYKFLEGKEALVKQAVGGAQPNISQIKIKNTLIPDISLGEQKQIVATLDKAFAAIDTAKANAELNLQNAKELFESYLQNVFEHKGDDWEEMTLGEVVNFFNGFAFKSKDAIDDSNTQVIRMGNLYQNKLNLDRKPAFYPDAFKTEFSKYLLVEDDLIISLTGTTGKEDYGYTVKIPKTERNLLLNQRIAKFIIKDENVINRNFLFKFLLSRIFLEELYKTANGTRQANLSTETMKGLFISFPLIKEQKSIVQKLDALSKETKKLEAIYTQKIVDLEEMKKSVLQKAFSGQLNTIN